MEHFEMVEKLREKAHVSYEEAKAALEASGWDLLDAMVYLEKDGKIDQGQAASFTTREEPRPQQTRPDHGKGAFARLIDMLAGLINKMNEISLQVRRGKQVLFQLPLIAFLLLLIFAFWFTIPAMVVALFFGVTYRFVGINGVDGVNRVMDKAADMAENIKGNASQNKGDGQ